MPLNFKKKTPTASNDDEGSPAKSEKKSGLSFMIRGSAAREEFARAQKRAKERKEKAGGAFRFWLKEGEERQVTFLDGTLDDDGMLDIPYFYEHTVPYESRFENIRCVGRNPSPEDGRTEPCPLCEAGDEPAYVGILTIIDWTEYEDRDGNKHEYARRLYPAKLQTLQKLQKKAAKLGEKEGSDGISLVTFDIARTGDRVARVGDDFEFVGVSSRKEIAEQLDKPEHAEPADYDNEPELVWRTAEEILEMGLGGEKRKSLGAKKTRTKKPDAAGHI
ncbi:MAG: hypothetical protein V3U11_11990 [Planctomycetota bacterium]